METKRENYYKIIRFEKYLIIEENYELGKFYAWISNDEKTRDTLMFCIEMTYDIKEQVDEYMNEYFTVLHIAREILYQFV